MESRSPLSRAQKSRNSAALGGNCRSSKRHTSMVENVLVSELELVRQGADLLRELDRQKIPVESMFWLRDPDQGDWRLIISSPLVESGGPAPMYRKVDETLGRIRANGLALSDISLFGPRSREFRDLLFVAQHSPLHRVESAWVVYRDAIVYRWNSDAVVAELDCQVKEEQLSRAWDNQPGNHPRVLFHMDGSRVTIRLHPQHPYPIEGESAESMKRAFQIALHRPDAFPACKVRWLN